MRGPGWVQGSILTLAGGIRRRGAAAAAAASLLCFKQKQCLQDPFCRCNLEELHLLLGDRLALSCSVLLRLTCLWACSKTRASESLVTTQDPASSWVRIEECRFRHRLSKLQPGFYWGSATLWRFGNESHPFSGFWLITFIIWPAHTTHTSCHQKAPGIAPSSGSEEVNHEH